MYKLIDIASVIRSKNSGPGELTLDIIFKNHQWYEKAVSRNIIDKTLIAKIYRTEESKVLSVINYEPANAIKITMKRHLKSGDIQDSDIYGAQQHAPLLMLEFEEL
ncbi:TPA: DUF4387 domain-containing protein [Salmonella enterica]|uniref:DUF4387 domain-containing protein n=1 Tax=Salmonella enterica I TaxID=59201 RepID=A0A7Z1TAR6_SALET|nr:DUF4387 domain-containing protein [Salmonella enterica]EBA7134468.1 DUF4387 domain-containing protein [Salmonella enterica]PUF27041.1 DUF4387 domain-containing protein [Salmonella enterica subsp. enterica]PUF51287.1 DUF4387 domain-containing protein [Salmonella enterica subsp. enterica]HCA3884074.1 DUF4387 domain-containing protein [Salmonella enterica]